MSKVLAIDFGLKRCGLAISDEAKIFAFGLDTVDSSKLMDAVKKLVMQEKVDEVVLGLPLRLNDEDAHITQNVRLLGEALNKEIPEVQVHYEDERFTSKMAAQSMHLAGASKKQKKEKGLIDKVSATIILQSFLESR